ncbi:hypothetical protein ACFL4T_10370 [candidate division KSB1 bacterium]
MGRSNESMVQAIIKNELGNMHASRARGGQAGIWIFIEQRTYKLPCHG